MIVATLVLFLAASVVTVLPATSPDTSLIIGKLNKLHDELEGEKTALQNKVNAVIHQIEAGAFNGALNKMVNDVRKSIEAWVEDPHDLLLLVDEIIEMIRGISPTADFEISTPPYRLDVVQGGFNTTEITITSINNFNRKLALNATTTALGVTLTLDPDSVTPPVNGSEVSTLRVEASQETAPEVYEITVTGTSGSLEHEVTIPLKIIEATPPPPGQDWAITASPTTLIIQQGRSNTSIIAVTSINDFSEEVSLAVTSAQITGVNTTLNQTTVIPPPNSHAISVLVVDAETTATVGSHILTITGESNSIHHSVNISLTVTQPPVPPAPDFSINAFPTSLTIEREETAATAIILASLKGFSGSVTLMLTPEFIPDVVMSLTPGQVTLTPDGFATASLKIIVDMKAELKEHEITVTATSGNLRHNTTVSLKITEESKPPRITSVLRLPERAPAYNETAKVLANVIDLESGLKDVILGFSSGGVKQNLTMTLSVGLFEASIPPFRFNASVQYRIYASDKAGNWAVSALYSYIVDDPYSPTIDLPSWQPREPGSGETVTVNATVNEPANASGIKMVVLWFKNSTMNAWKHVSMTPVINSANWTATISNQSETKVEFYVEAIDMVDNRAQSLTQEFSVAAPAFPLAWILAAIAILASATGGGAYYIRRKRRKGATPTSVPSAAVKPIPPTR